MFLYYNDVRNPAIWTSPAKTFPESVFLVTKHVIVSPFEILINTALQCGDLLGRCQTNRLTVYQ